MRTKIDVGLTPVNLASLGRLLLSLHDFLVDSYAFPYTAQYGKYRPSVTDKLNELYDACTERIHAAGDVHTSAAMLPTMFAIAAIPSEPLDNHKYQECDDMAATFIGTALSHCDDADWQTEHSALRVIIELAEQMDEYDRKKDGYCKYLLRRITAWAKTMSADDGWEGLSDTEALSRLEVMNRNSYKLSDSRYDRLIEQSLYRFRDIAAWDAEELSLGMALAANAVHGIDMQTIEVIAEQAATRLPSAQPDGDECRELCALLLDGLFYRSWNDVEAATVA